jgi:large subunit ribosomal protein L7/L12|tara:strand:+ start:103 stop:465 length:363 start_codon:yes stop_codon:yes gene_type:complete
MNKNILDMIGDLTVAECILLIKDMENNFGVSAEDIQPVVIEQAVQEVVVEEVDVVVMLTSVGDKRVNVVKAIREYTSLGLKESLEIAKAIPVQVGESMPRIAAEELKRLLEGAGGTVEIK